MTDQPGWGAPGDAAPTPDEIASLWQVEHLLDQRWPETKIEPSLTRISALLDLLGSPQKSYPSIHIAGTNGTTSVARMVDALLTALHQRTPYFVGSTKMVERAEAFMREFSAHENPANQV